MNEKSKTTRGILIGLLITILIVIVVVICIAGVERQTSEGMLATPVNCLQVPGGYATIQSALDIVQPGECVLIAPGTYSESLTLKVSGTVENPIIIYGLNGATVTYNGRVLNTAANVHYVTIVGLRLVSTSSSIVYTVELGYGNWNGSTDQNAGGVGYILRNCYIEGSVRLYGHNNLIEACELNGRGVYATGIKEQYSASHDNFYLTNIIHDYTGRGIWSMQRTRNAVISGNTIYNIGGWGINCDGAADPVYSCNVTNNKIFNVYASNSAADGAGIQLENDLQAPVISGNTIYNTNEGIKILNYGPDVASTEYRNTATNGKITGNQISVSSKYGIRIFASPGWTLTGNTITKSSLATIALFPFGGFNTSKVGFLSDYNQYDVAIFVVDGGGYKLSQWQAMGYDIHSTIINGVTATQTLTSIPSTATYTRTPTVTGTSTQTSTSIPTFTSTSIPTVTKTPACVDYWLNGRRYVVCEVP